MGDAKKKHASDKTRETKSSGSKGSGHAHSEVYGDAPKSGHGTSKAGKDQSAGKATDRPASKPGGDKGHGAKPADSSHKAAKPADKAHDSKASDKAPATRPAADKTQHEKKAVDKVPIGKPADKSQMAKPLGTTDASGKKEKSPVPGGVFGMMEALSGKAIKKIESEARALERQVKKAAEEQQKPRAAKPGEHKPDATSAKGASLFDAQALLGTRTYKEIQSAVSIELNVVKKGLTNDVNAFIKSLTGATKTSDQQATTGDGKRKGEKSEKTAPGTEHNPDDQKGKQQGENPDKLTPKLRAEKGVTSYEDPRTHQNYHYDSQGRIDKITAPGGRKTQLVYENEKSSEPKSVVIEAPPPRSVLAHRTADKDTTIHVDQKTGSITVTSPESNKKVLVNGKPSEKNVLVETHYSPDGTQSVVTLDAKDKHRLSKDLLVPGDKGMKSVGHYDYYYFNAAGEPSETIDPRGAVVAIQSDAQGRTAHQYRFKSGEEFQHQRVNVREDVKYTREGAVTNERHEVYDLSRGKAVLAQTTDKSYNESTGDTVVHQKFLQGGKVVTDKEAKFDRTGKITEYKWKDEQNKLDLTFKFDESGRHATSVTDAHRTFTEAQTSALLSQANLDIDNFRSASARDTQKVATEAGPTPPREGTRSNGTLVWKEGNEYTQATVKDGAVFNAQNQQIGTVQDNGTVSLNGKPSFNICNTDGAAFHGTGTNHDTLDLCGGQNEQPRKEGFNGVFTNGAQKYKAIGGNLYDEKGKFYGHVDENGKVTFDKSDPQNKESKQINSAFGDGNWRFEGNENGKARAFDINKHMSNGDLYLPTIDPGTHQPKVDSSGQPVPPTHYVIRMGMIINPETKEELGKFTPPQEDPSTRELKGGSIETGNPPQKIDLSNFTRAVFRVQETGADAGRVIQGVSAGSERQADGSVVPGKGGLLNLSVLSDDAQRRVTDAQAGWKTAQDASWFSGSQSQQREAAQANLDTTQRYQQQVARQIEQMLTTGQVTDGGLSLLGRKVSSAEAAALGDGLERQRKELDHPPHVLEALPKDTSTINGTVKVPDSKSTSGVTEYDIRKGHIYKKGTDIAVGSINDNEGRISWTNPKGQLENSTMSSLKGAVWHLEYPGEPGKQQKVDWITAGDHRIYSVEQLKQQAAKETAYADSFNNATHSQESKDAAERARKLNEKYGKELDAIVRNGIPANTKDDAKTSKDLDDITGRLTNPAKNVRAELFREKEPPPPKQITVPDLTKENVGKVTGAVRVGNDHYYIEHGKVFRETVDSTGHMHREKQSCGTLNEGYVIKFNDPHRGQINLAEQDRVILKFKIDGENKEHRILGMGATRIDERGQTVRGGLVEADELMRQAKEAQAQALKGNLDYFKNMPALIGGTTDALMGNRAEVLQQVSESIQKQTAALNREFDQIFNEGLSGKQIDKDHIGHVDNNQIDHDIKATQQFMREMNLSAQEAVVRSQEGQELQKQTADAAAMAAMTVLTAGAGAGLATLGLSRVGLVAAELGTGMASGALTSVAFRQTFGVGGTDKEFWDKVRDNAGSGAIEGLTMAAGSAGGRIFQEFAQAARLKAVGAALTPAQEALINSRGAQAVIKLMEKGPVQLELAEKGMTAAYKLTNAFAQTAGFNLAGGIREGSLNADFTLKNLSETGKNLLYGTMWMLAGEVAGAGLSAGTGAARSAEQRMLQRLEQTNLGKTAGKLSGSLEEYAAEVTKRMPARAAEEMTNAVKHLDQYVTAFAKSAPTDMVNAFTNSALGGMVPAFEQERERIAAELHVPKEAVSDELLSKHINYSNIYSYMFKSGLEGAVSAPFMSALSAPLHAHAERQESHKVAQPAELMTTQTDRGSVPVINENGMHLPNKVVHGDTVWAKTGDNTWVVKTKEGPEITVNGKMESGFLDGKVNKHGQLEGQVPFVRFTDAHGVRETRPDGSILVKPHDLTQPQYWMNHEGKVTQLTHGGTKYDIAYNKDHSVRELVGSNGEKWTMGRDGWTHTKEGRTEKVGAHELERTLSAITGNKEGGLKLDIRPDGRANLESSEKGLLPAKVTLEAPSKGLVPDTASEAHRAQENLNSALKTVEATKSDLASARERVQHEPDSAEAQRALVESEHRARVAEVEANGKRDIAGVENERQTSQANIHKDFVEAQARANREPTSTEAQEAVLRARERLAESDAVHTIARAEAEARLVQARAEAEGQHLVVKAESEGRLAAAEQEAKASSSQAAAQKDPSLQQAAARDQEALARARSDMEKTVAAAREEQQAKVAAARVEADGKVAVARAEAEGTAAVAKREAELQLAGWKAEHNPGNNETQLNKAAAQGNLAIATAEHERGVMVAQAQAERNLTAAHEEHSLKSATPDSEKSKLSEANKSVAEARLALAEALGAGKVDITRAEAGLLVAIEKTRQARSEKERTEAVAALNEARLNLKQVTEQAQKRAQEAHRELVERQAAQRRLSGAPSGTGDSQAPPPVQPSRPFRTGTQTQARDVSAAAGLEGMRSLSGTQAPRSGWSIESPSRFVHKDGSVWSMHGDGWQLAKDGRTITVQGHVELSRGVLKVVDGKNGLVRLEHPDGRVTIRSADGSLKLRLDSDGAVIGQRNRIEANVANIDRAATFKVSEDGRLSATNSKGEVWVRKQDGSWEKVAGAGGPLVRNHDSIRAQEARIEQQAKTRLRQEQQKLLMQNLNNFMQQLNLLNITSTGAARRRALESLEKVAGLVERAAPQRMEAPSGGKDSSAAIESTPASEAQANQQAMAAMERVIEAQHILESAIKEIEHQAKLEEQRQREVTAPGEPPREVPPEGQPTEYGQVNYDKAEFPLEIFDPHRRTEAVDGRRTEVRFTRTEEKEQSVLNPNDTRPIVDRAVTREMVRFSVADVEINGARFELAVPEHLARELEQVQQLKDQIARSEGDVNAARQALSRLRYREALLPGDILPALEALPIPGLVKRVELWSDRASPQDPQLSRDKGYKFVSVADAGREGVIRFFESAHSGERFSALITPFHEWSHLVKFSNHELSRLFDSAAKLEERGYYAREYGRTNNDENFAVHLGEEFLHPDPDSFYVIATNAPLRSAMFAEFLKDGLAQVAAEHRSPIHERVQERLRFVEESIRPAAREGLKKQILVGDAHTAAEGIELLGRLGNEWDVPFLRTAAENHQDASARRAAVEALSKLLKDDPVRLSACLRENTNNAECMQGLKKLVEAHPDRASELVPPEVREALRAHLSSPESPMFSHALEIMVAAPHPQDLELLKSVVVDTGNIMDQMVALKGIRIISANKQTELINYLLELRTAHKELSLIVQANLKMLDYPPARFEELNNLARSKVFYAHHVLDLTKGLSDTQARLKVFEHGIQKLTYENERVRAAEFALSDPVLHEAAMEVLRNVMDPARPGYDQSAAGKAGEILERLTAPPVPEAPATQARPAAESPEAAPKSAKGTPVEIYKSIADGDRADIRGAAARAMPSVDAAPAPRSQAKSLLSRLPDYILPQKLRLFISRKLEDRATTRLFSAAAGDLARVTSPDATAGRPLDHAESHGRKTLEPAAMETELARLRSLIADGVTDNGFRARLQNLVDLVDEKAAFGGLASEEAAKVYHLLSDILHPQGTDLITETQRPGLPDSYRQRAVAEALSMVVNPHLVSQGENLTCNVATLESDLYRTNPSAAIRVVADIFNYGKFVTKQGAEIRWSVPGETITLKPGTQRQDDILFAKASAAGTDVHHGTIASHIFQKIAVNEFWSRQGEPLCIEGQEPIRSSDVWFDGRSLIRTDLSTPKEVSRSPLIAPVDIDTIRANLTGEEYSRKVLVHSSIPGAHKLNEHPGLDTAHLPERQDHALKSEEHLLRVIEQAEADAAAKAADKIETSGEKVEPAVSLTVAVNCDHEPFAREAHGAHGWHVVNIVGKKQVGLPDGTVETYVLVSNQWGKSKQHLGGSEMISLRDLYRATLPTTDLKASRRGMAEGIEMLRSDCAANPKDFLKRMELMQCRMKLTSEATNELAKAQEHNDAAAVRSLQDLLATYGINQESARAEVGRIREELSRTPRNSSNNESLKYASAVAGKLAAEVSRYKSDAGRPGGEILVDAAPGTRAKDLDPVLQRKPSSSGPELAARLQELQDSIAGLELHKRWAGAQYLEMMRIMYESGAGELTGEVGTTPGEFAVNLAAFVDEACIRWKETGGHLDSDGATDGGAGGKSHPSEMQVLERLREAETEFDSFKHQLVDCLQILPENARNEVLQIMDIHSLPDLKSQILSDLHAAVRMDATIAADGGEGILHSWPEPLARRARFEAESPAKASQAEPADRMAETYRGDRELRNKTDEELARIAQSTLVKDGHVEKLAAALKAEIESWKEITGAKEAEDQWWTAWHAARKAIGQEFVDKYYDRAHMRELLKDNKHLQAVYDAERTAYEQYRLLCREISDQRRARIGTLTALLDKVCRDLGVAPIDLSMNTSYLGEGDAAYKLGTGRLFVKDEALKGTQPLAEVVKALVHELDHNIQDSLVVKKLTNDVTGSEKAHPSEEQIEEIRSRYQAMVGQVLEKGYLLQVLQHERKLSGDDLARVKAVSESFKRVKVMDDLRQDRHIVSRGLSNIRYERGASTVLEEVMKPGNELLAKRLFGAEPSPMAEELIAACNSGRWLTDAYITSRMQEILTARMEQLNARIDELYPIYRSWAHEQQSFAAGELAWRKVSGEYEAAGWLMRAGKPVAPAEGEYIKVWMSSADFTRLGVAAGSWETGTKFTLGFGDAPPVVHDKKSYLQDGKWNWHKAITTLEGHDRYCMEWPDGRKTARFPDGSRFESFAGEPPRAFLVSPEGTITEWHGEYLQDTATGEVILGDRSTGNIFVKRLDGSTDVVPRPQYEHTEHSARRLRKLLGNRDEESIASEGDGRSYVTDSGEKVDFSHEAVSPNQAHFREIFEQHKASLELQEIQGTNRREFTDGLVFALKESPLPAAHEARKGYIWEGDRDFNISALQDINHELRLALREPIDIRQLAAWSDRNLKKAISHLTKADVRDRLQGSLAKVPAEVVKALLLEGIRRKDAGNHDHELYASLKKLRDAMPSKESLPELLTEREYVLPPALRDLALKEAAQAVREMKPQEVEQLMARVQDSPLLKGVLRNAEKLLDKTSGRLVDSKQLEHLLENYTADEQSRILRSLEEENHYHSVEGLKAQFVELAKQVEPFSYIERGSFGEQVRTIDALVLGDSSQGHALAYLFRKLTGVNVIIHEVRNRDELIALESKWMSQYPVILFDNPILLKHVDPAFEAHLRSSELVKKPAAVEEFCKQVNIFDIALAGAGHGDSLQSKLRALATSPSQPQRADGGTALKAGGSVPQEMLSRFQKALSGRNQQSENLRRAELLLFLLKEGKKDHKARYEQLAEYMAERPALISLTQSILDAQRLHKELTRRFGADLDNVVFVSNVDSNGSTHFATHLLKLANAIDDSKFVDFKKLNHKQHNDKILVYVDDLLMTGSQASKANNKIRTRIEQKKIEGAKVVIAPFRAYEDGLSRCNLNAIETCTAVTAEPAARYEKDYPALATDLRSSTYKIVEDELKTTSTLKGSFGNSKELAPASDADQAKIEANKSGPLFSDIVPFYMVPNNSNKLVRELFHDCWGMLAAHNPADSYAKRMGNSTIPNSAEVYPGFLWRGHRPQRAAHIQELRELGVDMIIDLSLKSKDEPDREDAWVKANNGEHSDAVQIEYWHEPLSMDLTQENIDWVHAILEDAEAKGRKVFIHCYFGKDRTGIILAALRMQRNGWNKEAAVEEMKEFGFNTKRRETSNLLKLLDERALNRQS